MVKHIMVGCDLHDKSMLLKIAVGQDTVPENALLGGHVLRRQREILLLVGIAAREIIDALAQARLRIAAPTERDPHPCRASSRAGCGAGSA